MKATKTLWCAVMMAGALSSAGCAYGGVGVTQDNMAVVTRNDGFLFGLLRRVYVCQVTPAGLANCVQGERP